MPDLFAAYPNYSPYRTLMRTTPMMFGEDVYALQTALMEMGLDTGGADGYFGDRTHEAVRSAQQRLGIVVDGLAGGGTQTAIVKRLANEARTINDLPKGLVFGQCQHESSCRLGNYSAQRPDASFDAGVAQRNSNFHPLREAFHVENSIELLGVHLAAYRRLYGSISDVRRRYELAAGSWNAPAFTNWIAQSEGATVPSAKPSWWPAKLPYIGKAKPGDTARAKIEEYMKSATAYMELA